MADCLYGRVPVMVWSYLAYTVCVSISFLVVSFATPVFYLVFALVLVFKGYLIIEHFQV